MSGADAHDVVVVGGGPAGAVMAWTLAERGVRVAVVDRARFPRDKVCGDFIEPGGLRILDAMQCRKTLEASSPLPITHVRVFLQSRVAYRGAIPYYEPRHDLPPHGYIVPRRQLDACLLERARAASARVYEGCAVTDLARERGRLRIAVRSGKRRFTLGARLVVGADGTESIVARSFGLARNDRRHISISQRGYAEGVSLARGEAAIWFDDELFPGYAWMFPMSDGRANVGLGVLSESAHRDGLSVPRLFEAFLGKLRARHPGCAKIRLTSRPVGGIVKMYGGIGRNHADGALLIGDAGCFVDPMTGEGITPAMESALLAASTVTDALERGRFDARTLSRFERDFRRHFDPSMRYLDLCATLMRNRHYREFWLGAVARGFEEATADPFFARVAGASFGGPDVRPLSILGQVGSKLLSHIGAGSAEMLSDLLCGRAPSAADWLGDLAAWQRGGWRSLRDDPLRHAAWTADVVRKLARLQTSLWRPGNPRLRGVAHAR